MNGFDKRTQEKRKMVLEAAFNLMNTEAGMKNLTTEQVAKHANVGKTTIFKYFGNKENLIHEVYKLFINKISVRAKEIIAEDKPFEETLISISMNKIRYLEKINKQFYLDLMDYFTEKNNQESSLLMQQYNDETLEIMLDLFHRGRKEGKVDLKYSDEFLLLYFQAIVEGISSPQVYEKILPYTEQWTEMLIKGIAPKKQ